MAKTKRVSITKRAAVQRIKRQLAKSDQLLKACRQQSRCYHDLGDFYVVDASRNAMVASHVDLETIGRELGVLAAWETIAEE